MWKRLKKAEKPFSPPTCWECGVELPQKRADYNEPFYGTARKYCDDCLPVMQIKETWQPMINKAKIVGVYHVRDKNAAERIEPETKTD